MCDHVTLWNRWGNHMLDLSLSLTTNWPCWLSSIVGELLHTTVRNDHCLYVSKVCSVSLLVCHRWLHIFGHVRIPFWNNRSYPSFRLPLNWRSPHVTWLDGSDDDVQLANIGIHHRYINNGWSTYWSAVRRWSWIQACWWRSRSRWSDIWRSHRCLFTFFSTEYTVETLNFTKLRPISTTIYMARTCTSSAYRPVSCIWLV